MLVHHLMSRDPVTVSSNATLREALNAMVRDEIRALPVVDDGALVGIITDRDMKMVLGPGVAALDEDSLDEGRLDTEVSYAMTAEVETISTEAPVSAACRLLLDLRVGAVPVVAQGGELVGILSVTDLLAAAVTMFEQSEG